MLECVAVCYSVTQCVAVCCSVLQCVVVCCSVLRKVAYISVGLVYFWKNDVAVCCSGVAVCCSEVCIGQISAKCVCIQIVSY